MSIHAKMAARETPTGRKHESDCIFYDCMILIVGCVAVAFWIPPIIYAVAAGHLLLGLLLSPVWWIGALLEVPALAVKCALFLAGIYATQVFYAEIPPDTALNALKDAWPLQCAAAIVVFGIIGNLMAYPGTVESLVPHLNRDDAARRQLDAS